MVNSGADDLLLRPFSTTLLGQRIEAHVERRKGFVITTEYVGPDRRKEPGGGAIDLFDPPNSLKMKAKEKLSADVIAKRLDAELQTAREKLHEGKTAPRFLPGLHPVAADAGAGAGTSPRCRWTCPSWRS